LSNYSACPENRVCPEIFQAWGAADPPHGTPMVKVWKEASNWVAALQDNKSSSRWNHGLDWEIKIG